MEQITPHIEKPKKVALSEIPPIVESRNMMISERAQLKDYVEGPLLSACEELYDKNIRTLASSANKKDIESGEAYIIIDFDSLSEENKQVACQFAEPIDYDGMKAVLLSIPVHETTEPDDISRKANDMASTFHKQAASWIPKYSLDYLKKAYGMSPEETQFDDPSVWSDLYYDPEEKLFYMSEEHYEKAHEMIGL